MPTQVVFETATIADAMKKAAAVAPAKGMAFDKAAGVLLEIGSDTIVARATNLEIFYMEWVGLLQVTGDTPVTWRLPAQLLASVLGSLPIGSNAQVTFTQDVPDGVILVQQGRTKARFNPLSAEYYPEWTAFDPNAMVTAPRLGERLKQVTWAASTNVAEIPLNGVHIDGESVIATDRYRCATVPLKIANLSQPVTVPGNLLVQALSRSGDVEIAVDGSQLLVMPDETTQIRTICYEKEYPNVRRIMRRDTPERVTLSRDALVAMINRAQNFAGAERVPVMRVYMGSGEVAVMMRATDVGLLGDVIEVPGQANHTRKEFLFTPKNLLEALGASPNDQVTLGYDPETIRQPWWIDGGSGYEAWVAARAETETGN